MRRRREGFLLVRDQRKSDDGFQRQWCSLGEHEFKIGENSVIMEHAEVRKTTSRTLDVEDYEMNERFTLQLPTEKELDSWFKALKGVDDVASTMNTNSIQNKSKKKKSGPLHRSMTFTGRNNKEKKAPQINEVPTVTMGYSGPIALVDLVRKQSSSNYYCCDCNGNENVEWISINLLCVVCIKCSGVHRSLGTHISKVRSLTLDNFTSPEVLHILRHNVDNSNVNDIYESRLPNGRKIDQSASDSERLNFISSKYRSKNWVDEIVGDIHQSLQDLIESIHLSNIYRIQKCLAKSKCTLREIVRNQQSLSIEKNSSITVFQDSLKQNDIVHGRPLYYITEFLLLNGLPVDSFPSDCSNPDDPMYKYWWKRSGSYGTDHWIPSSSDNSDKPGSSSNSDKPGSSRSSASPSSNSNDKSANSKRWSLNPIPTTAQVIMAPANLLTVHRKLSKRGHNSANN